MITKRFKVAIAASMLVLGGTVHAAAKLTPEVSAEVLKKSGLVTQLAQLGPQIQGGLNLNPALAAKITEAQLDSVRKAFEVAFQADKLEADARVQLASALTPDDASKTLAWLNSDLGRRIGALEDEAGKSDGFQERAEAAAARFQRLPQRRIERYEQLLKATRAGEGGATIAINTTMATARGVASLASDSPDENLDAIRAQIEQNRPKVVETLNQQFLVLFSGAYASLEDQELDQYIAFSESPAGSHYNEALIKVIDAVMTHAALDAGQRIAATRPAPSAEPAAPAAAPRR